MTTEKITPVSAPPNALHLEQPSYIKRVSPKPASELEQQSLAATDDVVTVKAWVVVFVLSASYGISFWVIPSISTASATIATQLGNPADAVWFTSVYTLALTVAFLLCGANSDLFGRRWFILGGSAKSTKTVIAAMTIIGFGGGNCQLAAFALPELLPNKWRHIGVALADGFTIGTIIIGPVGARYAIISGDGWRWLYYGPAIGAAISFGLLFMLYYPPKHPRGVPWRQAVRDLDYFGGLLFTVAVSLILTGIVYTSILPASSPTVIGLLVSGFGALIIFALWETFASLKQPLTPPRVFAKNYGRDLTAPCVVGFVVTMFYYGANVVYPTMISVFFTTATSDFRRAIYLSLPQGFGLLVGTILLSYFGGRVGHWRWTLTGAVTLMTFWGALLALGTPARKGLVIACFFLSNVAYGWAQFLSITFIQFGTDQVELGIAGGLAGVFRSAGGSLAVAVYSTILGNTQSASAAKLVPEAVTRAGLNPLDVPAVLKALPLGSTALFKVPGMTAAIVEAAEVALQNSYVHGFKITELSALAFGVVGIIASICCSDIGPKMTPKIEVFLENDVEAEKNKFH
ncbi:fungal trichothecene efflux pump [Exophiala viscosa]|uniref:Fungal trichothecene efflux pump n=1 Tax=Exophiala viscosa TaxID=2486360 RepID=A0AAN6E3C4_9EURO|nr:fungal trichothecene efflux pump [Exophiala viscosa]KAI1626525.1 fungal trichothecene efflux pump [Exophiala viscosa]